MALLREFLDWQAPWLLQLQNLSVEQRDYLEQQAVQRTGESARCHRLYPKLIDEARITAARVEAKLRGRNETTSDAVSAALSIDVTLISPIIANSRYRPPCASVMLLPLRTTGPRAARYLRIFCHD